MIKIKPNGLVHTPDDVEDLISRAASYSGEEKVIATVFTFMTLNMIAQHLIDEADENGWVQIDMEFAGANNDS